ncbi:Prolipoprotein diacylglyceryl transferase, putative [Perkinsus marinus ATCC 50983]|uniref:Prolipoprotein diacylglyceryl transferase, putative n=1 Tax=Perkinsus marinus (strain ATCC 50983 / TXsc) TaxID=423536 RepID=C5LC49_PERM5|nr:Prolipoprotein diacylglyceryl transferase, putative [Perkinsus marinus ATCC 50983]EER05532.1 Prolipoprotein diacylglyceryl transferase, putative [Perkinsus marinus ATCC 50983]|eukprot:XP_002773716.1 Prolipoprotein diacylglyceryl transferase, putative [Perkinsus marinus ATCC 50983]
MALTAKFVRPVLFTVFGINVYVYGLCMAIAFMVTYSLGVKEISRVHLKVNPSILVLCAMLGGLVGARVHYALTCDSSALFALNTGLSFQGGLIGGIIATTVYTRYCCQESVGRMLDVLAPLLMLGHAIGKVGCFLSGDGCYGPPSEVPWAMSFPNGLVPSLFPVHPTPLYEMVTSGLIAMALWQRRKEDIPMWTQCSDMLMLLGLARFFIEYFRSYDAVEGLNIDQYQMVAVGLVMAGAVIHWTLGGEVSGSIPGRVIFFSEKKAD